MASLAPLPAIALERAGAVFATGFRGPDGSYGIATLTESGQLVDRQLLPARSHGLAFCAASGRIAAFARRPGTFAAVFSATCEPFIITAPDGRHFFGHGCFSPDGHLLYASENDFDNNRGMIGVYDARNAFARRGEFQAGGIGTHDLTIDQQGSRLIVANGGISTHPNFGRTKLNLDHMEPSMVLVDTKTGDIVQKHGLPTHLRQLSTRHVALDSQGRIWFACQFEGPDCERPPLIGYFAQGEDFTFVDLPGEVASAMANYVGAIAVNRAEGLIAATSVKGGAAVILDTSGGTVVSHWKRKGISGVAAGAHGFVFSTETGQFGRNRSPVNWDQHIVGLNQSVDRPGSGPRGPV